MGSIRLPEIDLVLTAGRCDERSQAERGNEFTRRNTVTIGKPLS